MSFFVCRKCAGVLIQIASFVVSRRHVWLPGVLVAALLNIAAMSFNLSMTYMGNTSSEVVAVIFRQFWHVIAFQFAKILLAVFLTGCVLGIISYPFAEIARRKFSPRRWVYFAVSASFAFILFFLQFLKLLVEIPQLFVDNFTSKFHAFKSFHYFLTGNFSPDIFFAVQIILVIVSAVLFFYLHRKFIAACARKIVARKKLMYAVISGLLLFAAWIFWPSSGNNDSSRPDIIIIASDALRPDRFGANGYPKNLTPNIDRIIKNNYQVLGMNAAIPRTFPAVYSMLTSSYPVKNMLTHMFPRSRDRSVTSETLGSYLAKKGYRSAIIGNASADIFPRYDFGFETIDTPNLTFNLLIKQIIMERMLGVLPFIINKPGYFLFPEMRGIVKAPRPDMLTEKTIDYLKDNSRDPKFVFLFHSVNHFPFSSPYPYYNLYTDKKYAGEYKYYKQVIVDLSGKGSGESVSDADIAQINQLYDGCVHSFDDEVGRLYDYLESSGRLKNTIVVITSDHGESLYDDKAYVGHGDYLKGYIPTQVPFVLCFPGMDEKMKGRTDRVVSSSIDIVPTILDCAKMDASSFGGISLLRKSRKRDVDSYAETGIWFDNDKKSKVFYQHRRIDYPDITAISEIDFDFKNEVVIQEKYENIVNVSKYRMIISGKYKLVYLPLRTGAVFELYDVEKDPLNEKNIAPSNAQALVMMKEKFFKFMQDQSGNNFIRKDDFLIPAFNAPIY